MFKKRNYEENTKQESHKWKQKSETSCDDIIFSNGVREINFDGENMPVYNIKGIRIKGMEILIVCDC